MQSIRETAGQDLQWRRVKWWKREFELRSGDGVLAKLYRQKGMPGVIGEAMDGQWNFKRRSFWNGDIVITDLATQAEIGIAKRGRKKSLAFADGRTLTLKKTSRWKHEWVWLNDEGTPLIHFQSNKHLTLEYAAFSFPELSLLVILGWHLIVLQQEEEAATAASASISG
jgi:hypothetical protein